MKRFRQERELKPDAEEDAVSLVLPLSDLDRTMLPVVGGKAANLGELIRAGFSVPAVWILRIRFVFQSDNCSRGFSRSACKARIQGRPRFAFLA